jgi:thioesterase domain-containing protein
LSVVELLQTLQGLDVRVWVEGDKLRVNAPEGALTPELRAQLQASKSEVVKFLQDAAAIAQQARAIIPLQAQGTQMPIFAVPGHNGDVFCYRALSQQLGADQPFFGLQPPGLDGLTEPLTRIEDLAAYFAVQIRQAHTGPLRIAGYCAGGATALELAHQLSQAGTPVQELLLFGTPYISSYRLISELNARVQHIGRVAARHTLAALSHPTQAVSYLRDVAEQRRAAAASVYADVTAEVQALRVKLEDATLQAVRDYQPVHFDGAACLFLPSEGWRDTSDTPMLWKRNVARYSEQVGPAGCDGDNMLREAYADTTAALLRIHLRGQQ